MFFVLLLLKCYVVRGIFVVWCIVVILEIILFIKCLEEFKYGLIKFMWL